MSEYYIDPLIWYSERELEYPPIQFVTVKTLLTFESKQWVLDKLTGRFSITKNSMDFILDKNSIGVISFEDPKEAVLFELTWS